MTTLPATTLPAVGHADLRGKVVLVTGASRGIGAAAARHLGRCGATVVLAARDISSATEHATAIVDDGGASRFELADG